MGTDPRLQLLIVIIGVWGGAIVPVIFVVHYTWIARWWKNPLGRTLVALDLCIFVLRAVRLEDFLVHGRPIVTSADWVASIAMIAIPVVIGYRTAAFELKRRRLKREARKTAEVLNLVLTGLVP